MADLVIRIAGDISDLTEKLNEVVEGGDNTGSKLAIAAGVAGAAFLALAAGIGEAVKMYAESERAAVEINQALQNQGIYSDALTRSYREQAEAIEHVSGVDADSITKGQAKLQSLIGQKEITSELTQAMIDLSIKTGSVDSASEILGRAVEGNTRGLKQFNIEIDDNLTKDQRLTEIIEKVNQKFGGLAEATNQGLGKTRGLKTELEEFVKSIGEVFAPTVSKATGILVEFLSTFNKSMREAKDPANILDNEIAGLAAHIADLEKGSKRVGRFFSPSNAEDIKKARLELEILKAKREEIARSGHNVSGITQDLDAKEAADKAAAAEKTREQFRLAGLKDHLQAERDAIQGHSAEVVKLEKEQADAETALDSDKKGAQKQLYLERLAFIKDQLIEQKEIEVGQQKILQDEILENDKAFQEGSIEESKQFIIKQKSALLSSIDTEHTARIKAATDEAKLRIKNHNEALQDQIKFGKTYAAINLAMHSEIYTGSKTAFGELAALTSSSNSTLKAIGKVASVANIVMKTAESAMNIYAGFSTIPIVGPELGIIGAAAAVAFGAEQVGRVTAAADGGILSGGIPGKDSIPMLGMRGELVVPTKNFDEVVDAVANQRSGSGGGGQQSVLIGFDGPEAQQVITARQTQSKALGTYRGVS